MGTGERDRERKRRWELRRETKRNREKEAVGTRERDRERKRQWELGRGTGKERDDGN